VLTATGLTARFGNLQPCDFESLPTADHALGGLGGESEAHQPRQLMGREAVRVSQASVLCPKCQGRALFLASHKRERLNVQSVPLAKGSEIEERLCR
jgi:ribosomal protein S27AE